MRERLMGEKKPCFFPSFLLSSFSRRRSLFNALLFSHALSFLSIHSIPLSTNRLEPPSRWPRALEREPGPETPRAEESWQRWT